MNADYRGTMSVAGPRRPTIMPSESTYESAKDVVVNVRALFFCLIALGSAGCQSNDAPFVPDTLDNKANVLVYVYWPGQRYREKSGQSPEVQLDGVPVGLLDYKTYFRMEIPPGKHEFRITGDSEQSDWEGTDKFFSMPVSAGETKYVRLLVRYDQTKNTWQNPGMSYVVQFLPASASVARREMGELEERSD